jgi:hypothetical protein
MAITALLQVASSKYVIVISCGVIVYTFTLSRRRKKSDLWGSLLDKLPQRSFSTEAKKE